MILITSRYENQFTSLNRRVNRAYIAFSIEVWFLQMYRPNWGEICETLSKLGQIISAFVLNILTAHNWQIEKKLFLLCYCHKIYRVEAVGLKSSTYTWKKIMDVWNLGQFLESQYFDRVPKASPWTPPAWARFARKISPSF